MNSNEAKKFLPLIVALSEGKTIQYFSDYFKDWKDTTSPEFKRIVQYRIKPEPRTFYCYRYKDDCLQDGLSYMHNTEAERDNRIARSGGRSDRIEYFTVTEVL